MNGRGLQLVSDRSVAQIFVYLLLIFTLVTLLPRKFVKYVKIRRAQLFTGNSPSSALKIFLQSKHLFDKIFFCVEDTKQCT